MATRANRGKQFESTFKKDWVRTFPNSFCLRLPDQQSGYYGTSKNICDFICYAEGLLFLLELKSIHGNTFPLANLGQYTHLLPMVGKPGVRAGVIIWFVEHDKVCYVPISTITKLKFDNKKSVNVKYLDSDEYDIVTIPSKKLRVFLTSDYSSLTKLEEGK